MLKLLVKNLEEGFHLFYRYYMDYKSDVGEDVEELYQLRQVSQISVNWKNELVYNNYINEMQLMLYRIYDISSLDNYTQGDVQDCTLFLLENYKNTENEGENVEIHGNLIKLLYYLFKNFDLVYVDLYDELTESFEESFNNYTNKTLISYLSLEVLGILIYIIFFIINFLFLFKSNKYIFQNILCIFLDFTQKNKYTFNNKNYNLLLNKSIINYISLLNEFSPKKLDNLKNEVLNFDLDKNYKKWISSPDSIHYNNINSIKGKEKEKEKEKSDYKDEDEKKISKKNILSISKTKKEIKTKQLTNNLDNTNILSSQNISKVNEKKYHDNNSENNNYNNNKNIHKLNFDNLSMIKNNNTKNNNKKLDKKSDNQITNLLINSSNTLNLSENTNHNNSSLLILNESNKSLGNIKGSQNLANFDDMSKKNEANLNNSNLDFSNLTIDKIILFSRIVLIQAIKIIMIIFIVFSIIFIVYYIIKIICGFLIITKIGMLFDDFKTLCSQYNEVVHYWNSIKTLFVLPNSTIYVNITNVENFFNNENNKNVLNLLTTRISNYKRTAYLYNLIFDPENYTQLLEADFCDNHHKCFELINSTQNILLNGLNSAISLYGKEIENYYKDFLKVKDELTTKDDIKNYFIKDTFEILGLNLNHIFSHLQEKFFKDYLKDEEDLKNQFNNEIKIFNIIALAYCLLLNIFSIFYVFNYINNVNDFVETSSLRINIAMCHLKEKIKSYLR